MVYIKNERVTGSMCDSTAKLSHVAIFQLVQDGVTDLMGDLHIDGLTAMRKYNAMWVFVKNVIRIFHRPEWRTQFVLRSFVSSHSAVKLIIDTEILTESDHLPIAHSRLELCALDLETGKIRKANTVGVQEDMPCEAELTGLKFSRFPQHETELMDTIKVQFTNLDFCSHTNNIEYVRFVLNTYQTKDMMEHEIEQIEVHYVHQTFEGNTLSIARNRNGAQDYYVISSNNSIATECAINWRSQKDSV